MHDARLAHLENAVAARLTALARQDFVDRLHRRDATLWTDDAEHHAIARRRLGWLDLPETMRPHLDRIEETAGSLVKDGFQRVLLLGMGGSSLCVEVLRDVVGVQRAREDGPGWPDMTVLDTTDPETIAAVDSEIDAERTAAIVASKSGTTLETRSLHEHFAQVLRKDAFIAITDPGTSLATLGTERGFRAVFENPEDVGGRYSALSLFGLVPFALMGNDPAELLDGGALMREQCRQGVAENPGVALGAILAEAAMAGRDKLTLVITPGFEPFALWVEQLVAESTGKRGKGIFPVADEPLRGPDGYHDDRLFVRLRLGGERQALLDDPLDALAEAGHPVVTIEVPDTHHVGAELYRWEVAVATACSILGVNAFDEPNVTESKEASRRLIDMHDAKGSLPVGEPVASSDAFSLHADRTLDVAAGAPVVDVLARHLARIGERESFVLLAYLPQSAAVTGALHDMRKVVGERTKAATSVGFGPRYLHSTGQLHKGGPDSAVFLVITRGVARDPALPGRKHGFGTLQLAQALGDVEALQAHGRRVVRVHLEGDADEALGVLTKQVTEALGRLGGQGETS